MQLACCLLDNSETKTGARVLLTGMEPVEYAEYLLVVAWFNPNTVVAHEDFVVFFVYQAPSNFDTLA
jgi:hypothetical protein